MINDSQLNYQYIERNVLMYMIYKEVNSLEKKRERETERQTGPKKLRKIYKFEVNNVWVPGKISTQQKHRFLANM